MAQIGILALQGDFAKHGAVVRSLGHNPLYVKDSNTLSQCERLIVPGGESTTFIKLIDRLGLREALVNFAQVKPVFGTCAGLIVLSTVVVDSTINSLGLIDLKVRRNAYGRQVDSFVGEISVNLGAGSFNMDAYFIRAPKIESCEAGTRALAWYGKDVVMASNKNILVATFHPELTEDNSIHKFFIEKFNT